MPTSSNEEMCMANIKIARGSMLFTVFLSKFCFEQMTNEQDYEIKISDKGNETIAIWLLNIQFKETQAN